jgi:hypothetical protein
VAFSIGEATIGSEVFDLPVMGRIEAIGSTRKDLRLDVLRVPPADIVIVKLLAG